MKNRNSFGFVLALTALSLAGCSAKVSGGSGDVPQLPGFVPGTNSPTQPVQGQPTALEGRWKLGCSALNAQLHADGEVNFSGNTYSSILTIYLDAQCTLSMGSAQAQSGAFTLPAAGKVNFTQANGESDFDIYEIDQKVLYMGLQPGTSDLDRPQTVDRDLGYTYAGAAVIVNN